MEPVIQFEDVVKIYPLKAGDVTALNHISFSVERGEFISIMGPSGSGKSTLLTLMGCLDKPTSGKYLHERDPDPEYVRRGTDRLFAGTGLGSSSSTSTSSRS